MDLEEVGFAPVLESDSLQIAPSDTESYVLAVLIATTAISHDLIGTAN